jgi:hypothetical protein
MADRPTAGAPEPPNRMTGPAFTIGHGPNRRHFLDGLPDQRQGGPSLLNIVFPDALAVPQPQEFLFQIAIAHRSASSS